MSSLLLLMGLPCSGKTHYSQFLNGTVINVDDIRKSVTGSYKMLDNHIDLVHDVIKKSVYYYLNKGENVILDGLFLSERARGIYIKIAQELGCPIDIYFFDTSYDVLKDRIEKRNNQIENDRKIDFYFLEQLSQTIEIPTLHEGVDNIFYLNESDLF